MPRLHRLPDLKVHPADIDLSTERKAEFGLCLEPDALHGETMLGQVVQNVAEIFPDGFRQHEAVMQAGPPFDG